MIVIHLNYGQIDGSYVHLIRMPDGSGKLLNNIQLEAIYNSGRPWRYAN